MKLYIENLQIKYLTVGGDSRSENQQILSIFIRLNSAKRYLRLLYVMISVFYEYANL